VGVGIFKLPMSAEYSLVVDRRVVPIILKKCCAVFVFFIFNADVCRVLFAECNTRKRLAECKMAFVEH
jgi:hypothetical protein